MRYIYNDEDNAPMVMDLPLPYRIRAWEEMIREWEGKQNADGQGQIWNRRANDGKKTYWEIYPTAGEAETDL